MFRILIVYAGLLALVGLAILGAAQTDDLPDVAPLPELTASSG